MTKSAVFFRYIRKVFLLKKEEEEAITYKEVEENIFFMDTTFGYWAFL
ncbi:MAG: hypothetical protein IPL50_10635 [Chitinophagaceae bacterium]|nr:hypothetical protein [Chitinophagaceae bacterium]